MKLSTKKVLGIILTMVFVCGALVGCEDRSLEDSKVGRGISNFFSKSDIVYQASTRFLYSLDGGSTWSETIQEIPINSTYYLAVEMQVSQSEETSDEKTVVATITIPSTTVLDCYLDDHPGVSITGRVDAATNSVSYDFNIIAGTSPNKFRVVFECKPLSEGRAEVQVVYDDSVSEGWDASGTIKYVKTVDSAENLGEKKEGED